MASTTGEGNTLIGRVGVNVQEVPARGSLTQAQTMALLAPINPTRILSLDGNSHVSQQDIRAHLIRIFGFGNYDLDVLDVSLVFEHGETRTRKRDNKEFFGWDVCYRALVRLTIRNPQGEYVAHYEDGSTATAQSQPSRGDAHDLAYKSAISLSVKRAAIALGDQFGLSLYNKGQKTALVKGTMVGMVQAQAPADVQEGLEPQVALGNDEVDRDLTAEESTVNHSTGEVAGGGPADLEREALEAIAQATEPDALRAIWDTARDSKPPYLTQAVKSAVLARKHTLDNTPAPAEAPQTPAEGGEPTPAPTAPETAAQPAPEGAQGEGWVEDRR